MRPFAARIVLRQNFNMNHPHYITVFGATGKIGTMLLHHLSAAGIPTIAVTRNKTQVQALPFITWMEADMTVPSSLAPVLENSRSVFLLSGYDRQLVAAQTHVIQAAKEAGVTHIVKVSSGTTNPDTPLYMPESAIALAHGAIEQVLKSSGIPWTLLQPNGFMQNWLGELSATVQRERKIYSATGDGTRAYIDARDIAETAFTVLTRPEPHLDKAYLLTGGEAINIAELAAIISREIGDTVTFVSLTLAEAQQRMEQAGLPHPAIDTLLAYISAQREGKAGFVSPAVEEILHKPARTAANFIRDHIVSFR